MPWSALSDRRCEKQQVIHDMCVSIGAIIACISSVSRRGIQPNRGEKGSSNLKKSLDDIEVTINAIKTQIKVASKMNTDPSVGIDRLAWTCVWKQEHLTRIGQSLVALKTKVTSKDILNNIRCRIKQQTEATTEDSNVICYHMPDYTWEMAFRKLEDQQNSGLSSFLLQDSDLRSVILS